MSDIAPTIDHTNLKPETPLAAIDKLCDEARQHNFAAVCVNGRFVERVAHALTDTPVQPCAVAGFPLGAGKPTVQAIEATAACKDGAQELDFVAHLPLLAQQDVEGAKAHFMEIVKAARAVRKSVVVKVIIESAWLMQDVSADEAEARIAAACRAAKESGCDFIKTSSGFHPAGGATVEAVQMMARHADGLAVKAAGGIKTYEQARAMLEAGAHRIGCSAGVRIVQSESEAPADT
jgi:deoxyribose-phosphate aldolase